MKESVQTLIYVVVAVVCAAFAYGAYTQSQPNTLSDFVKVGEEFYPDFDNPTAAKSLEIFEYDENLATISRFKIEYEDGVWRIPSHHNYPAEAKEELYKVAASLVGVKREALAGRLANSHRRYGVVDPLTEDMTVLKGRGQRIKLTDADGNLLVDYIIGKHPQENDRLYYLRRPDEEETYLVELKLDNISTKFADWIDPDLLQLNSSDLTLLSQQDAKIKMVPVGAGRVMPEKVAEEVITLDKENSQWKLEGLTDDKKELKSTAVNTITTALAGLEYEGVRRKPGGLTGDLKIDQELLPPGVSLQEVIRFLSGGLLPQLQDKGYTVLLDSQGNPQKVEDLQFEIHGEGGEMVVGTRDGLKYYLHFGKTFRGTRRQIQVGDTGTATEDEDASLTDAPDETGEADEDESSEKEDPQNPTSLSRYLMVRVAFDPSLVPGRPTKPTEPKALPPSQDPGEPAIAQRPNAKPTKQQMDQYQADLERYEEDLKTFETKLDGLREEAAEMNQRFADWYYLVSNESYDKLKFTRDEIVQLKSDKPASPPAGMPQGGFPGGGFPGGGLPGGLNFGPSGN
ncbi:DUF4340 domain-containing protein [Thalassoroseus pseudoceratinae]|uniref:DUF4340 domain-containing protein n=1 Tax=Thalassoroseus pseudoceratinae TaxID=2713176 RepID=UPI00141FDCAE|nr:DUF4340 domain-containing protein [Thalassoroseus pseudoceratinae]